MTEPVTVTGAWQDGSSSASLPARLWLAGDQLRLSIDGNPPQTLARHSLRASPKLGRTPRYLQFAELAGQFETTDHDALDALLAGSKKSVYDLIHHLEHHLLMVVASTLVVLGLGASYFIWGIPTAAEFVAHKLPDSIMQEASEETLLMLNKRYFSASALSEEQQQQFRQTVNQTLPGFDQDKLHLLDGGSMGANALALPDGTIVFTDQLIKLADYDQAQLLAVFGHELGHIHHKHSLRQILQNSAISLTIALIGGDVSSLGDIVLTLPLVFSQLAFSREFELEADRYAVQFLKQHGYQQQAFAEILTKLHNQHCQDDADCNKRNTWLNYLSTHPHLAERLQVVTGER